MSEAAPAAVVFDNDGLLLDTESVWTRAEQQLYERRGREFTLEHKQELVGTSAQIAAGIFETRLDEPGRGPAIIEELNELVMAELAKGVEAMVGARELLDELERAGRLTAETAARIRRKPMWLIGCAGIVAGLGFLVLAFVQLT